MRHDVTYRDGVGRTGTFLTMYSVLEKLKPEHLVDVFQILKKARIQRPMLVESEVSYKQTNKQHQAMYICVL